MRNTPPLAYRLMRNAHSMTTRTSARPSTWMPPDQLIEICGTVSHEARKRRLISILLAKLTSPVFQHWALSYLPFGRAVRGFRREFFWALLPRTAFCSETRGASSPQLVVLGLCPAVGISRPMPILPVGWHPGGRHRHEVGIFPVVVDPLLDLFLVRGDRRPAVDIPMPAVAVPLKHS